MTRLGLVVVLAFVLSCPPAQAEYQPKGKRDPFVPFILSDGRHVNLPGEEGASTGLGSTVLQGILFDPRGSSAAILNGRVLRENEEWEGIKLLKIENNSVTISRNGETYQMILRKPETEDNKESKTE